MNSIRLLRTFRQLFLAPASFAVLTASFLLATVTAHAQQAATTGTVSGRVANAATGNYLENAELRIVGTEIVAISAPGGRYLFTDVPAGDVSISAAYTGLETMIEKVSVPPGGTATLDFNLTALGSKDIVSLGEFVVSGSREGNARAIVDQRRSINIKNVISSDAFGSVSEDNLGEFLKYMPGLSINYNENDARTVSVRGLPSKYSSVMIDGMPVASADFAIGTGREFQFEQVSLSTIGTVEVNKSPLADQPASSLAGSVNVKSKSAFDQKGRRITYSANLTTNSYASQVFNETRGWDNKEHFKTLPGGSLSFSDTFMDGRLGLVAAVSHTGTYVDQKIIAALGRVYDNDPTNNETEIPKINTVNWQDGPKPTYRDAVLINLDYKLTPDIQLSLRTSYNYYNAPFHNRNWTFAANTATQNSPATTADSVTTTATSATDTTNSITVAGTNFRKYGATFNFNPALSWKINDILTFDGALGYSRSYQWYDSDAEGFFNIVNARMNGVTWGYSTSPGSPRLQVKQYGNATSNTGSIFDIANYNSNNTAQTANRDAKDQVWAARGDLTIKLAHLGMPTTIKIGADERLLTKNMDTWTKVWSMNVNPTTGINLTQYKDPLTDLSFHKGETFTDLNGKTGTAPSLDKWKLYDLFKTYNTDPYTVTTAAQQPFFLTAAQAAANLRNKLSSRFDFKETIQSGYIMANVTPIQKLIVSAGLRFEKTDSEGRANDDLGNAKTVALTGITDTNNFTYINVRYGSRSLKKQSYDNFFPSLQARYSITHDLLLRASYHKSILRPDPANIARSLVVSDDQTTFTDTNPDLRPEFADNFDTRIEYYFEPVGVLSAGLFLKKMTDTQMTISSTFDGVNVPQDILDLGYTPAAGATFNRTINGPDNTVWGYELEYSQQLSFLPGAFSGLGVFANYTYTEPYDLTLFSLSTAGSAVTSGIPKHAVNAGINYKLGKFSGGIKANWLGDRLLATPGYTIDTKTQKAVPYSVAYNAANPNGLVTYIANAGIRNYEKARLQIDVNLQYEMKTWATVFLNVANINDSRSIRFANNSRYLIRDGGYGAKYTLGVKGTF